LKELRTIADWNKLPAIKPSLRDGLSTLLIRITAQPFPS